MSTVDLKQYGYASRAAFLRDAAPSPETFQAMAASDDWRVQKSTLLHPACPIEIRSAFSRDPIWYKRLVAIFATKAPADFWRMAEGDPDKRVQAVYKRKFDWESLTPEQKEADYQARLKEYNDRQAELERIRNPQV